MPRKKFTEEECHEQDAIFYEWLDGLEDIPDTFLTQFFTPYHAKAKRVMGRDRDGVALILAAFAFRAAGFLIVPMYPGSDEPHVDLLPDESWRSLLTNRPTEDDIARWYRRDNRCGISMVLGKPSGNVVACAYPDNMDERPPWFALSRSTMCILSSAGECERGVGAQYQFFRVAPGIEIPTTKFYWGQFLGQGNLLLMPPSINKYGEEISWWDEVTIAH